MRLTQLMKTLKSHQKELSDKGVKTLAVFGSVARKESKKSSDIDLLVDFDSKMGLLAFIGVKMYLEKLLNCDVDLVTKSALHPALKPKILQDAKDVF